MTELSQLSGDQLQAFQTVRANVKDEMSRVRPEYDDSDVLRFVIARKYDVKAATEMMLNHFKWFETYNVPAVVQEVETSEKFKFHKNYFPHCYDAPYGVDKSGDPYFYERHGTWDVKYLMKSITPSDFVKFNVWRMEMCLKTKKEYAKKLGRPVMRNYTILDLGGLNHHFLNKKFVNMIKESAKIEGDNYPEMLKAVFLLNCPSAFPSMYPIIKPFIDPNTIAKVKVHGYNNYKDALLAVIDANQLPTDFGGSNTKLWRQVPTEQDDKNAAGSSSATVHIGSSGKHVVQVQVTEVGTKIFWDFNTDANDLAFAVTCNDKEVVPSVKYKNCTEPIQGHHVCKTPGLYSVIFDNSFALLRSKTVRYRIDAFAPSSGENEDIVEGASE